MFAAGSPGIGGDLVLLDRTPVECGRSGYCAPADDRWVVTNTESLANQGNDAGTLHPNPAGHQALSAVALRFIKPSFFPNGQARAAG